jgi:prepilin-type N-terminal cleavage/methylation domain-containing protein
MARLNRKCTRRGVSLVEMSVVLSLLLTLTLGAAEYGWMFLKSEQIVNAARAGVRYAVTADVTSVAQVTGSNSPAVVFLNQTGIPIHGSTVSVPTGVTPGSGNAVTVTVSVPYSDVALTGFSLLPVPETLTASVSMAKEGP